MASLTIKKPDGVGGALLAATACIWLIATTPSNAQDATPKLAINIAAVVLAEPEIETPLPIQIAPGDKLPQNSFLRVWGLPPSAILSLGHVISPGSWAVPLSALPTLKLQVPASAAARSQLSISLVGVDGAVLAESKVTLVVMAASALSVGGQAAPPPANLAAIGSANLAPRPAPQSAAPSPKPPENPRALALVAKGNETALQWYARAVKLGAPEAGERLRRLTSR